MSSTSATPSNVGSGARRWLTALLVVILGGVLILAALVSFTGYGAEVRSRFAEGGPSAPVTDLHDVGQLQAAFNQDVGTSRLVVLFSPT